MNTTRIVRVSKATGALGLHEWDDGMKVLVSEDTRGWSYSQCESMLITFGYFSTTTAIYLVYSHLLADLPGPKS